MKKETEIKYTEKTILEKEINDFKVVVVVSENPDTKVNLIDMINFYVRN